MSLKKCNSCGEEISNTASKCPKCGDETNNPMQAVFGVVIFLAAMWYFFGYQGLEKQVANDAVKEYNMAVRSGTKADICVHAMMVSAAYSQANDEKNYKKWKKIEKRKC